MRKKKKTNTQRKNRMVGHFSFTLLVWVSFLFQPTPRQQDKGLQKKPIESSSSNDAQSSGQSYMTQSSPSASCIMVLDAIYKDLHEKDVLDMPTTVLLNQRIEKYKNERTISKAENETQSRVLDDCQRHNAQLEAHVFNLELKLEGSNST